jgi:L-threonylcarbamoyladenylate synthase
MDTKIRQAIEILNTGGIIIFPTDTAYGIGCRMDNEKSVERLFRLRKRPLEKSVPVLVNSIEMAQYYTQPIPQDVVEKLMKPHWPGGLTIVLQSRIEKVPPLVRGGGETLGVRMPDHPVPLELIKGSGVPILAPSANFHGEKTPFTFSELNSELTKLVDFVIEGDIGNRQASTVIDCSVKPWKVLREGVVKI